MLDAAARGCPSGGLGDGSGPGADGSAHGAAYAAPPMPTDKRQRKRSGREARLAAERAAARAAARRRKVVTAVAAVIAVFAILLVLSQTGGDDEASTADTTDTTAAAAPVEDVAAAPYGDTPCAPDEKPEEPTLTFDSQFQDCLEDGVDYAAEVETPDGTFTIDLLEEEAPATVNNFVNLARSGFYDGSTFHRVIEGFVAQGGDPVGQPPGSGGPGYAVTDELPEAGQYEVGSVAMANSGPDTQGSQFFVVTGEQGVALPPQYSLFGDVTEGMDAVMAIAPGEPPAEPTTIEAVEIVER